MELRVGFWGVTHGGAGATPYGPRRDLARELGPDARNFMRGAYSYFGFNIGRRARALRSLGRDHPDAEAEEALARGP